MVDTDGMMRPFFPATIDETIDLSIVELTPLGEVGVDENIIKEDSEEQIIEVQIGQRDC